MQRHLGAQVFTHSFTNQVLLQTLADYLAFVHKTLLDTPPAASLLAHLFELRDLLDEAAFVHRFFYHQSAYSTDLRRTYRIRSDAENFDLFYELSETLHACSQSQFIVRAVTQASVRHLAKFVHSLLFVDPNPELLRTTLKIGFKRNALGDFEFTGAPRLLAKTLPQLFTAVQALALLKQAEPIYFRLLTSWSSFVDPSYDPSELAASLAAAVRRFAEASERLSVKLAGEQVDRDQQKLAAMQRRLERLKALKGEIERQAEERERLRQIEIFKRVQLQHFLQQQVEEKRLRNKFERELRVEAERSQLLDRVLQEKEAEKQQLLREIEGIGRGVDDEIERALIRRTLEKIQLQDAQSEVDVGEFAAEEPSANSEMDGVEGSSVKPSDEAGGLRSEKDLSSNLAASTLDHQTAKEGSLKAELYPTVDPSDIGLRLKDSFADLVEASLKPEPMANELDEQLLVTPRKQLETSLVLDEPRGESPSSRTAKKLRQVDQRDLDVDLKAVSKLVVSNLVQLSRVQLPDPEDDRGEADQQPR